MKRLLALFETDRDCSRKPFEREVSGIREGGNDEKMPELKPDSFSDAEPDRRRVPLSLPTAYTKTSRRS